MFFLVSTSDQYRSEDTSNVSDGLIMAWAKNTKRILKIYVLLHLLYKLCEYQFFIVFSHNILLIIHSIIMFNVLLTDR